ncbi:MAG: ABC transporter permease [Flavobacteriales bacterium]|nr:ABC transporter permease [Flavobacteriales bacterium]
MNFPYYIARRYLFSRKSHNAINLISGISVLVMTILTAALFTVLSVFNGFESLIVSLFNSFDPDLKITAVQTKSFDLDSIPEEQIRQIKGVAFYSPVIEENVLLKYDDKQYIATMKGVTPAFFKISHMEGMMVDGSLVLTEQGQQMAVLGYGVASALSIHMGNVFRPINLYVPKKTKKGIAVTAQNAFNIKHVMPSGIFSIQQDFDSKYILISLDMARELTQYENRVNAIELGLTEGTDPEQVRMELRKLLGDGFEIRDRFEQHAVLYKIMKSEKWAIFLILTFTLVIGAFNIIGALTMLIVEKKKDIRTLWSMGADAQMIRRIFMVEGMLISLVGCVLGILLGFAICWIQYKFGVVGLEGSGTFVIEAYPVEIRVRDMISVFITVACIGWLAAWIPSRRIHKNALWASSPQA